MLDKKNIYFLGIGGIGMSALARYFHQQNNNVSGYDKTPSPLTDVLKQEGIEISFTDSVDSLPVEVTDKKETIIVYTPAIPQDNVLFNHFKNAGYALHKRAEVLGWVTKQTVNLSVAGTHGKTTTSCMVATILQHSNKKFSAFLGGISSNLGSNYYYQDGEGEHFSIVEADEYDRSFLHLSPSFMVMTSTDADHLDIYGAQCEMQKSYTLFSDLVEKEENRFYSFDSVQGINGKSYSAQSDLSDYRVVVKTKSGRGTHFDIYTIDDQPHLLDLYLNMPGSHNLENAVGAALMTYAAGVTKEAIREGLANFKGIKRRFEYIIESENLIYIDDYAHHPSELRAIISSVRDLYPNRIITAIFQPHLFSRTQDFMQEFADELSQVDELILLPIYPARELPIDGVTSEALLDKISLKEAQVWEKEETLSRLRTKDVEVLLTLGAGDIDRLVLKIKEIYEH